MSQISKWPISPLDYIINYVISNKDRYSGKVVVDHGCGKGDFGINSQIKNIFSKIYSFDFIKLSEHVEVADIKKINIEDSAIDLSIFSLSLMGTNYIEFLTESNRILKIEGQLIISEVVSRLKDQNMFIKLVEELGFKKITAVL